MATTTIGANGVTFPDATTQASNYTDAKALAAAKAGTGVASGDLIQADATGLPVIDGSQLTGISAPSIATGSYAGDNITNRNVTTGFKCSLVIVMVPAAGAALLFFMIPSVAKDAGGADRTAVIALHATDGFTCIDASFYNVTGTTYYYWAISE